MTLASGNVLSLKSREEVAPGLATPGRMEILFRQFDEANITIIGLQESRIRQHRQLVNDNYILLHAPADPQGQGGVVLGLHTKKAYAVNQAGKKLFFTPDDCKIIAHSHRYLLAQILTPVLRCVIAVIHAPHSGESHEAIEDFWMRISRHLSARYLHWPVLLLADANCRLGSETSASVGPWAAENATEKSQPFHTFLVL